MIGGNPKTEITWWIDPSLGDVWKEHARDVTGTIQSQCGGAWKFKRVDQRADAQVVIEAVDHNVPGGAKTTYEYVPGSTTRVKRRVIQIDPTPLSNKDENHNGIKDDHVGWGTNGYNFNPYSVLMHELLHTCRLRHQANKYNTGNLADPVTPGTHQYYLSPNDVQDLKDAADRTKTPIKTQSTPIGPAGGHNTIGDCGIYIPYGALSSTVNVTIRPILEALPGELDLYPYYGLEPLVIGLEVTTDQGVVDLLTPATLVLNYSDRLIGDTGYFPYGFGIDEHYYLCAFVYEPLHNSWLPIGSSNDPLANMVYVPVNKVGQIVAITGMPSGPSYTAYRKELVGVVNMNGYGLENDYTFLNGYKRAYFPIVFGAVGTWSQLNVLYSHSECENAFLHRIYPSLLAKNPYDLAVDVPWVAQDWQVGTWVDPRDGVTKTTVTYWFRPNVGCAAPVNGMQVDVFDASDYEFTVWYNYAINDSMCWSSFADINHVEKLSNYAVKVYFESYNEGYVYVPTYPLLGPANVLESLLCTSTTSTFLGSDLVSNGDNVEYQFSTKSVVHVTSATKNGNPITEGTDYYIRAGYDVSPLHSVFVAMKTFAPTDTISITYTYAIPNGAGGTYLGSNLGYDWTDTVYSYGTHYPVLLTSTTAALNKNPYFLLEKPVLGEIDWRWTWTGTTYPHSGYYQINIIDVVKCTACYCQRGDGVYNPNYFPGADLDASDQCHIGILDLVTITGTYGQKFGTPTSYGGTRSDLDIVWYSNPDAAFAALQSGTVDMIQGSLTDEQKTAAESDPNLQTILYVGA